MITGTLDRLKRERASFARELSYVKECDNDDIIADRMDRVESQYIRETSEDYEEAVEMLNEMSDIDNDKEIELDRLMEATSDISFEQMIGLEEITENTDLSLDFDDLGIYEEKVDKNKVIKASAIIAGI